jgi:hypothetical protein
VEKSGLTAQLLFQRDLRGEESERLELIGGFVRLRNRLSKNREERFKFSDEAPAAAAHQQQQLAEFGVAARRKAA